MKNLRSRTITPDWTSQTWLKETGHRSPPPTRNFSSEVHTNKGESCDIHDKVG